MYDRRKTRDESYFFREIEKLDYDKIKELKLLQGDDQELYENHLIEQTFTTDNKSFDDAMDDYKESTKFAFDLPNEHFYSNIVRVNVSGGQAVFARIEVHKNITQVVKSFVLQAENPEDYYGGKIETKLKKCLKEDMTEKVERLNFFKY